jgi:hypothetical protein
MIVKAYLYVIFMFYLGTSCSVNGRNISFFHGAAPLHSFHDFPCSLDVGGGEAIVLQQDV